MRLARVRVKNWLCFRGEHVLKLDAKAYAIVARHTDDVEASNWSGKTALVEAIRFGLTGWHRKRLDDDWITHGEGAGEVELTFDTGERAMRSREHGRATKFYYWPADSREPYFKKEAEEALQKRIGLDERDFLATCYFEQRQMARLILARPEDRMAMISAWLQLEPLERCEDKARDRVNAIIEKITAIQNHRQLARERLTAALKSRSRELAEVDWKEAQEKLSAARATLADVERQWQENEARVRAKDIRDSYAKLVEEGKEAVKLADACDIHTLITTHDNARDRRDEVAAETRAAEAQVKQLAIVARGAFDGVCPIASIACPAKDQINAGRSESAAKHAAAEMTASERRKQEAALNILERQAWENRHEAQRKIDRVHLLREHVEKIMGAAEEVEDVPEPIDTAILHGRLAAARANVEEHARLERDASLAVSIGEEVDGIEKALNEKSEQLDKELRLAQAALAIFGKNGAQRRVAEEVLGHIENEANERLAQCGIPLSVQVQWSREGTGLAKACEACGAAFPASAKVKQCTRCNAPRGPQLVNKLDFLLSDQSGAAEDLAGIAVQLAASAWLRADRQSDWNVVVIDEAFGQLDAAKRRALSHHLADLVSSEQAFIIAHHAQVLDALPGRIEIVRDGPNSTVQVIA